jgi:hypothetical protein
VSYNVLCAGDMDQDSRVSLGAGVGVGVGVDYMIYNNPYTVSGNNRETLESFNYL